MATNSATVNSGSNTQGAGTNNTTNDTKGGCCKKKNKSRKNRQKNQDRGGWKGTQTDGVLRGVVITDGALKAHQFTELCLKGATYAADKSGVRQLFQTLTWVPDTAFYTAVEPTAADWTTITWENKGTVDRPEWVDKSEVNTAKQELLTKKYIMTSQQDLDKLDQFKEDQAEVIEVVRGQCDHDITNKLDAK